MDELTAIKGFRAERDGLPAEAGERIRRALGARMDAAANESRAFGEAVAGSAPPAHPAAARRGFWSRRRRVLAFAAATAVAAIVAGALVLSAGPTAQPASAAEILHQAATAASAHAALDAPASLIPGPGEYLFRKVRRVDVEGWRSPVPPLDAGVPVGGIGGTESGPHAYNALVAKTSEQWTGDKAQGRNREVLGPLQFWSKAEEERWKSAGSPLPTPFNPEYQRLYAIAFKGANELNSHVVDMDSRGFGNFNFPDTSKLPTDPKALRQEVEANEIEVKGFNLMFPKSHHLDAEQTTAELINCLSEGEPSPGWRSGRRSSTRRRPTAACARSPPGP